MNPHGCIYVLLLVSLRSLTVFCWTDEDLELFDLVESTDRKFYDILGVDQKASASDIRKAYRRLSTLYHPDKNKDPNAEETFRKIAAIADVLRNEEQRKKYDVILQTGLPDWREPIYYYRRVRNMGLVDLFIFLFCLGTLAQYLFAWAAYWEKKYEMEELVMSKMKKKAKQQKRGKNAKLTDDLDGPPPELCNLPKPRWQDLLPFQLATFVFNFIKCSPSYLKIAIETSMSLLKPVKPAEEEEDEVCEEKKVRQRTRKYVKPQFPELDDDGKDSVNGKICNGKSSKSANGSACNGEVNKVNQSHISEADLNEFKKAMKKFPNGTLQRWEKIAEYLNCSVSEVVSMAKRMKSQNIVKSIPASAQGVTGTENNLGSLNFIKDGDTLSNGVHSSIENGVSHSPSANGALPNGCKAVNNSNSAIKVEKVWRQEEQRLLEEALLKFPKETPARWDCIAKFVKTKTKEECMMRYKELAQQIKLKKGKEH